MNLNLIFTIGDRSMEWLKLNAKKVMGVLVLGMAFGAGVSQLAGCPKTEKAMHDAKDVLEKVSPFVPGEPLKESQ